MVKVLLFLPFLQFLPLITPSSPKCLIHWPTNPSRHHFIVLHKLLLSFIILICHFVYPIYCTHVCAALYFSNFSQVWLSVSPIVCVPHSCSEILQTYNFKNLFLTSNPTSSLTWTGFLSMSFLLHPSCATQLKMLPK